MRRYERNKSSGTTNAALDEDIKTAALKAFCPSKLEQHLAMDRKRLIMYEQVRSEIQAYVVACRSHFTFKTDAAKNTSGPMNVDPFGRGGKRGKKGKGDGKNGKKGGKGHNQSHSPNPNKEVFCWHCGKQVHLRLECWSNPMNQSGSGG